MLSQKQKNPCPIDWNRGGLELVGRGGFESFNNSFCTKTLDGQSSPLESQTEPKPRQEALLAEIAADACVTGEAGSLPDRPSNATTKSALMHQIRTNFGPAKTAQTADPVPLLKTLIIAWPSLSEQVKKEIMAVMSSANQSAGEE